MTNSFTVMLGGPKALLQVGGLAMIENMVLHGFFATTGLSAVWFRQGGPERLGCGCSSRRQRLSARLRTSVRHLFLITGDCF